MIDKGADYWNGGLSCACYGGHVKLINLMIDKGKKQQVISGVPSGLPNICKYCNKSIAEHLKNDYNKDKFYEIPQRFKGFIANRSRLHSSK
jgi:hypothetical protein